MHLGALAGQNKKSCFQQYLQSLASAVEKNTQEHRHQSPVQACRTCERIVYVFLHVRARSTLLEPTHVWCETSLMTEDRTVKPRPVGGAGGGSMRKLKRDPVRSKEEQAGGDRNYYSTFF